MISNDDSSANDDRRAALLAAIAHRRRLLSYAAVTRRQCEAVLSSSAADAVDAFDPAAAFAQQESISKAAVKKPNSSNHASKLVSQKNNKQRGSNNNAVHFSNNAVKKEVTSSSIVQHRRKRSSSSAALETKREMELSAHASFAVRRCEELREELSTKAAVAITDDYDGNTSLLMLPLSKSVPAAATTVMSSSSNNSSSAANIIQPCRLPIRKKTHWDALLQEMKLISSDYMQERRWKIGLGRVLAHAVMSTGENSNGLAMRQQIIQKVHSPMERGERISVDENNDENDTNDINAAGIMMATPTKKSSRGKDDANSNSGGCVSSTSCASPSSSSLHHYSTISIYTDVSLCQIMESKAVSHTLSVAIRDYWRQQRRGYGTDENVDQSRRLGAILNKNETPAMKEREDGAAAANISGDTPIVHSLQRKENDHVIDVDSHITDEEISKRIQCILDSISHFHNDNSSLQRGEEEENAANHFSNDIANNSSESYNLNPSQKQVVSSIESLWKKNNTDDNFNRNNMAAVLSGDYGTGKTVCACTLLWKRFIREKNGIQVVLCPIDSLHRWKHELDKFNNLQVDILSSHSPVAITSANVLLCDYQTFVKRIKDLSTAMMDPSCLYIDLRYSHETTRSNNSRSYPSDLFELWDAINMLLLKSPTMNRLLIEPLSENNHLELNNDDDGGDIKMQAKLLAMKMACIYHPLLFTSSNGSTSSLSSSCVGKRVVSWVHNQRFVLDNMLGMNLNLSNNHNDSLSPSVYLFHSILSELTLRVRFVIDSGENQDEDPWELRCCLPPRKLVSEWTSLKSLNYANPVQWQDSSRRGTSGEPNSDVAREMMESHKMKELLVLLVNELGVDIGEENTVCLPKPTTDGVSVNEKKALILASRSKSRKSISFFLSCLGIRNRVLEATCAAGWERIQNSIVLFNGKSDCRTNIIISSPSIVSSLNGGVCPTAADVVISVDQDFGSEAHLASLVKKIRRNKQNGSCKFVKITDNGAIGSAEGAKDNGLVCNGNSLVASGSHSSHVKIHTNFASEHEGFKEANATQHQLLPYGLGFAVSDADKSIKLGISSKSLQVPPSKNSSCAAIRHYVRSFTPSQSAKNVPQIEKAAAPKEKIVPKQEAKPSKKTNREKEAIPDVNAILAYDIPTAGTIDRFSEFKSPLHLLGSYSVRDIALSNDTRGFESLVYLPECHDGDSNANRKLPMSFEAESCIEANSYCFDNMIDDCDMDNMQMSHANSIILVAQKPQQIGGNPINGQSTPPDAADGSSQLAGEVAKPEEKKPNANKKAMKRQHYATEDKLTSTFFKKPRPMRRSFATRDATRSHNPTSIMLPVKLQCCLLESRDTSARMLGPSKERSASWTDGDNNHAHRETSHDGVPRSKRPLNSCQFHWEASVFSKTDGTKNSQSSKVLKLAGDCSFICNKLRLSESDSMLNQSEVGNKEHWIQSSTAKFKHIETTNTTGEKQLIAALKKSSTKKRLIEQNIPGKTTVDGRTSIKIMPAHASHYDTVHSGYAAQRKELWPLELISYSEKNPSLNSSQHLSQTYHQPRQYNGVSHISRIPMQGARSNKYEPNKK